MESKNQLNAYENEKAESDTETGEPMKVEDLGLEVESKSISVTLPTNSNPSGSGVEGEILTKAQRRRLAKKSKKQMFLSASETSPGCQSLKRPLTELSTHSPSSEAAPGKRPRKNCPPKHRMAIITQNFPVDKLSWVEAKSIQKEILSCIDKLPFDAPLPHISSSGLSKGGFVVQCDDVHTVEWLASIFHLNDKVISGTRLYVVHASELLRPVKVIFQHKDVCTNDYQILLKRLNRFNPKLKTHSWHVLDRYTKKKNTMWVFEIDLESAEAIRNANFSAYSGLCMGTFKILSKRNIISVDGKEITAAVEPTTADPKMDVEESHPTTSSGERLDEDSDLELSSLVFIDSDSEDSLLSFSSERMKDVDGSMSVEPSSLNEVNVV